MTFTRDGVIWLVGVLGGIITNVAAYFNGVQDLLIAAIPGFTQDRAKAWQARVQLAAALVGIVSGVLRMSPLALSPKNEMAVSDKTAQQTLNPVTNATLSVNPEPAIR